MKLLAVYDNGGQTADRYTAITDVVDHSGNYFDVLNMGAFPDENGYSAWGTVLKTKHRFNNTNRRWRTRCDLGRLIPFENLPDNIQEHIAIRLWAEL